MKKAQSSVLVKGLSTIPRMAMPVPDIYKDTQDEELTKFQKHQETAARPSPAEEARTLMTSARHVLSFLFFF